MRDYITFGKPEITTLDRTAIMDTLDSGWISTGPVVETFEQAIKKYVGSKYAVATSSCTAGLFLSLLCNDIGKGDEVIVPSMTFCATANVVEHVGATPVFVDIEDNTYCMSPSAFEDAVSSRTKAVIPVHFGGQSCDMHNINRIANAHNIRVIEDSAHALGAEYKKRRIGADNTSCFSFYPTKNITTIEGGIVTTNDEELAEKIKIYSNHGLDKDAWKRYSKTAPTSYGVVYPGYKFNMTDVSASLGLSQLKRIDRIITQRTEYAELYKKQLEDIFDIVLPSFDDRGRHVWHLFPILVENRDKFRKLLHLAGIGSGIHYEAVHLQPYYKEKYKYNLPRTEYVSKRTVSIPLQTSITKEHIFYISDTIKQIMEM